MRLVEGSATSRLMGSSGARPIADADDLIRDRISDSVLGTRQRQFALRPSSLRTAPIMRERYNGHPILHTTGRSRHRASWVAARSTLLRPHPDTPVETDSRTEPDQAARSLSQIEIACRMVADATDRSIPRIHVVLPNAERAGGSALIRRYAHALAEEYGVRVCCELRGEQITVTFERPDIDD
jgi:hypothetical protein